MLDRHLYRKFEPFAKKGERLFKNSAALLCRWAHVFSSEDFYLSLPTKQAAAGEVPFSKSACRIYGSFYSDGGHGRWAIDEAHSVINGHGQEFVASTDLIDNPSGHDHFTTEEMMKYVWNAEESVRPSKPKMQEGHPVYDDVYRRYQEVCVWLPKEMLYVKNPRSTGKIVTFDRA